MMATLQREIIKEILGHIDLDDFDAWSRFRLVCKEWRTIIMEIFDRARFGEIEMSHKSEFLAAVLNGMRPQRLLGNVQECSMDVAFEIATSGIIGCIAVADVHDLNILAVDDPGLAIVLIACAGYKTSFIEDNVGLLDDSDTEVVTDDEVDECYVDLCLDKPECYNEHGRRICDYGVNEKRGYYGSRQISTRNPNIDYMGEFDHYCKHFIYNQDCMGDSDYIEFVALMPKAHRREALYATAEFGYLGRMRKMYDYIDDHIVVWETAKWILYRHHGVTYDDDLPWDPAIGKGRYCNFGSPPVKIVSTSGGLRMIKQTP